MPEIFFISDTHFGHEKILHFVPERALVLGKTVEEHDEALIERWNRVVRPKDTVWHLGDIAFTRRGLKHLERLNGHKKAVLGNHDSYGSKNYLQHFAAVYGAYKMDDFLLTHVPIHPSQKFRFRGNIHGHLHNSVIPDDPFYCNVSCERINYQPIPFHVLKKEYERTESRVLSVHT